MDIDINIAIEHLQLRVEQYNLSDSIPPHTILEWVGEDPQPTEEELETAYNEAIVIRNTKLLREERNRLLEETDWVTLKAYSQGVAVPTEWATYQQALRDLPANTTDPANPTWPTKPS